MAFATEQALGGLCNIGRHTAERRSFCLHSCGLRLLCGRNHDLLLNSKQKGSNGLNLSQRVVFFKQPSKVGSRPFLKFILNSSGISRCTWSPSFALFFDRFSQRQSLFVSVTRLFFLELRGATPEDWVSIRGGKNEKRQRRGGGTFIAL